MFEHSEVKVKLLQTYLKRYFNILNNSKFIGDIYYFDLFSAEGIYENGGKGSPIIVLESIKNAYYTSKHKNGNSGKFHSLFKSTHINRKPTHRDFIYLMLQKRNPSFILANLNFLIQNITNSIFQSSN